MKQSVLLILALTLTQTSALAVDAKGAPDAQKAAMMQKMKDYGTPGAGHQKLQQMVGKWTFTSKMWEAAGAEPQTSSGTATFKMILNGHYVQQELKEKMGDMKYEGMGLVGFNNLTQKYETVWLDNMATGMMRGSGGFDEATQTLTDTGKFSCPFMKTGDHQRDYRTDLKMIDKDNFTFTMYSPDLASGKEYKMMELVYKRK